MGNSIVRQANQPSREEQAEYWSRVSESVGQNAAIAVNARIDAQSTLALPNVDAYLGAWSDASQSFYNAYSDYELNYDTALRSADSASLAASFTLRSQAYSNRLDSLVQ